MNKYPWWKYAIIGIAIVVSLFYAAPNFFGEVPAVQVAGIRAENKVDAGLKDTIDAALKAANLVPAAEELTTEGTLQVRFGDVDTQLKARDVVQSKLPQGFVVALNLVPNTPHWMQAMGAKPMYLGLDLRGGVHFLLQVDMKAAANKAVERYMSDARTLMRDKKVYYSGLARESDTFVDMNKEQRYFLAPSFTWQPTTDTSLTVLASAQRDRRSPSIPQRNRR